MIQIDSTFNTNALKLPLTILVGIANTGKIFSLAFSFIHSENKVSMDFIFESLKELVFDTYPLLQVIVANQGEELDFSMPGSMSPCILEFCKWHTFSNIKTHLVDYGYKREVREQLQPKNLSLSAR